MQVPILQPGLPQVPTHTCCTERGPLRLFIQGQCMPVYESGALGGLLSWPIQQCQCTGIPCGRGAGIGAHVLSMACGTCVVQCMAQCLALPYACLSNSITLAMLPWRGWLSTVGFRTVLSAAATEQALSCLMFLNGSVLCGLAVALKHTHAALRFQLSLGEPRSPCTYRVSC